MNSTEQMSDMKTIEKGNACFFVSEMVLTVGSVLTAGSAAVLSRFAVVREPIETPGFTTLALGFDISGVLDAGRRLSSPT